MPTTIPQPKALQAPARRSRANEVYEQLKRDIADFRMVPGDRFSEHELCSRLDVSRTPVRQALTRLQQEGLVEVMFRSGWRVLPFDFDKFDQLYDLRMVLETTAVQRLCLQDVQPPEPALQALKDRWLAPVAERSTDPVQVAEWDEDFHEALVRAAGNAEMARVHHELTERIRIIRRLDFLKQMRIDATYDEHAKILRAILARKADRADLLMRSHIETSQVEVRKITLHQVFMAQQVAPAA
ncbi:MAG: GntR family transcriptional regulator [Hydrogenophaga sp.]|uniref:GntR family transcriptional regulator n=1 Tax=Hydrogenophaga sp. TaxID=1904254 RepID=UPI001DDC964E|nr:GntR family transcriptional regulator [Hydrogenophaga sp.]MBW0168850.1 GntR family transcriptional regulator [Hydrogenophaga sp.]MBW0183380.1 GntR family transcriptional regulator [Hydrogenophaga sp.]